jgi:hypothetical protein
VLVATKKKVRVGYHNLNQTGPPMSHRLVVLESHSYGCWEEVPTVGFQPMVRVVKEGSVQRVRIGARGYCDHTAAAASKLRGHRIGNHRDFFHRVTIY